MHVKRLGLRSAASCGQQWCAASTRSSAGRPAKRATRRRCRGQHGQVAGRGRLLPGRRLGRADPRRLRLRPRVPCRALLARRPPAAHRARFPGDGAELHRRACARTAAVVLNRVGRRRPGQRRPGILQDRACRGTGRRAEAPSLPKDRIKEALFDALLVAADLVAPARQRELSASGAVDGRLRSGRGCGCRRERFSRRRRAAAAKLPGSTCCESTAWRTSRC